MPYDFGRHSAEQARQTLAYHMLRQLAVILPVIGGAAAAWWLTT